MTFKAGDKVKFLNDVGGGFITKIIKETAYIQTNDGFEIPSPFSELIKVEETFGGSKPEPVASQKQIEKKMPASSSIDEDITETNENITETDPEEELITSENCTLNIVLGLVPIKAKGAMEPNFNVYLISDCAYRMLYTFSVVRDNFVYGKKVGLVEDDTKVQVAAFSVTELKQIQSFKINCLFYKKGIYLPHEPVIYEYKIDALTMADPFNWAENDYFDEKAIVVNITEMSLIYEIERLVTETEEKYIIQKKRRDIAPKKQSKKQSKNVALTDEIEEVDLHIEKIADNFEGMSNAEILDIQMGKFTIALTGAIRNNVKKIVFIHGVGNGKLKYEISKALNTNFPKLSYQDASFKEYGFGATMVIIKK
jgi:hypothetical protein